MFAERARAYGVPIAFCNLVGGQDELVFDGHSFVVDADGEIVARARAVRARTCWSASSAAEPAARIEQPLDDLDEVYAALALGVRDYARKNGFERVLVGLSGGIDSALVALIAADALGAERLTCVVMPSPHSSEATQDDARAIARQPRRRADRAADRRGDGGLRRDPRRAVERRGARGRERPGADPRQPADGALQRPRLRWS